MKKYIYLNIILMFLIYVISFYLCYFKINNFFISIVFSYGLCVIFKSVQDAFIKNF